MIFTSANIHIAVPRVITGPSRSCDGIDFAPDGKIIVAKDQPAWNLMPDIQRESQ
jgi:hypothetical protein